MRGALDFIFPVQCGRCDQLGNGFCASCYAQCELQQISAGGIAVRGLGLYAGTLRRAILNMKDGRRDVAEALACCFSRLVEDGDVLVPVPTTFVRRLQRGFDGAEVLAMCASANRATRVDAEALAGRTVVLVDDVLTTGVTVTDCAATIAAAGGLVKRTVVLAVNP
ncbi:MAG: hypothetical protein DLM50_02250 [Candidatus Meridianibacter frigidus]|nr:MAG: hypothetical protein DLM50_02250 [Candidatus Eremiobacteraeota bacterium]